MEERKAKYSLFPTPPLSKPISTIRDPSPARPPDSLISDPQRPPTRPERSPPLPATPLTSEPCDQHTSPERTHLDHQVASNPQEQPPPKPGSPGPPSEMTVSSFSTASETSLKPTHLSLTSHAQQLRKRPRRAFIRHGLGGAGNYHKRPDSPPTSDYSGFLSSLLGTFSNKKRKARQHPEGDPTESSQYSNQALPLGAAEVLKRKMLGQASGGKRSTSGDRD